MNRFLVCALLLGLTVGLHAQSAPGAPTIGTAVVSGRATVTFTAPASDGGSPITLYTVTSSPGSKASGKVVDWRTGTIVTKETP